MCFEGYPCKEEKHADEPAVLPQHPFGGTGVGKAVTPSLPVPAFHRRRLSHPSTLDVEPLYPT